MDVDELLSRQVEPDYDAAWAKHSRHMVLDLCVDAACQPYKDHNAALVEVVKGLQGEVERLREEGYEARRERQDALDQKRWAEAEVERLQGEVERLHERPWLGPLADGNELAAFMDAEQRVYEHKATVARLSKLLDEAAEWLAQKHQHVGDCWRCDIVRRITAERSSHAES